MRSRRLSSSAVCCLAAASITAIFTIASLPSPAAANPSNIAYGEQRILELHNAERAARGIRPLVHDGRLQQFAREWAWKLAGEGRIYHVATLPARGLGFRAGGENIAYRVPSMTAEYAHIEWMKSDLHRKNLLDPAFSHAGVGISCATVNGRHYTVAVVEFGADASPSTGVPPLDPRAVGGDPYAGRPVSCEGAPRPPAPSGFVAVPPVPAAPTVTAPPKPAPAPPAPKPAAAPALAEVPAPGPPPVMPPGPPAPPAEAPPALPATEADGAPDRPAELAAAEPAAPEPAASELAAAEPAASEPAPAAAEPRGGAAPEIGSTRPVSNRVEVKVFTSVFFLTSLAAWLSSGFYTSRRLRRMRAAAAAGAAGYTQGSGEKSWGPRLGWQR